MKFEEIERLVGHVPHMPPERGKLIHEFVLRNRPESVLELGFAHGTSACYIAAALQENGKGKILTIDHVRAKKRNPNIHDLLALTGLTEFVAPVFCERSYTWELMKQIESATHYGVTESLFDFVFIDGGHTWDSDGFSFLLADRLLKPDGWVLFDDVLWTPSVMGNEDWVLEMPEEERDVAHVEKIFQLLVLPHPDYTDFEYDGTWAWARKKSDIRSREPSAGVLDDLYRTTSFERRKMLLRRYMKKLFGRT